MLKERFEVGLALEREQPLGVVVSLNVGGLTVRASSFDPSDGSLAGFALVKLIDSGASLDL